MKLFVPILVALGVGTAVAQTPSVCPTQICDGPCHGREKLPLTSPSGAPVSPTASPVASTPAPTPPTVVENPPLESLPEPEMSETPAPTPAPTSAPTPASIPAATSSPTPGVAEIELKTCATGQITHIEGMDDFIGSDKGVKRSCPMDTSVLCSMDPKKNEFATGESIAHAIQHNLTLTCYIHGYVDEYGDPMTMEFAVNTHDNVGGDTYGVTLEAIASTSMAQFLIDAVYVKNGNGGMAYRFGTDYDLLGGRGGTFFGPREHAISHISMCVKTCDPEMLAATTTAVPTISPGTDAPTPQPTTLAPGKTSAPTGMSLESASIDTSGCGLITVNNFTRDDAKDYDCDVGNFCAMSGERKAFATPLDFKTEYTEWSCSVTCVMASGAIDPSCTPTSLKFTVVEKDANKLYEFIIQGESYLITSVFAKSASTQHAVHGYYEFFKADQNGIPEPGNFGGVTDVTVGTPMTSSTIKGGKDKGQVVWSQKDISHFQVCVAPKSSIC